jgi:transposase
MEESVENGHMKPYSSDLRRRIIEAIQENQDTQKEIADRFSVSVPFVEKLWQRFRETGSYEALAHRGGRERALKDAEELIRQKVAAQPDITLAELVACVAQETGHAAVSKQSMNVELQRLKLPRKKSRSTLRKEKLSGF